ncbi:AP2 domain-containing protein [Mammaliicoccus sciuri]
MSGHHLRKHGLSTTKIYQIFWGMLNRCYVKENRAYEYYGGKGIEVCEEWNNFDKFLNFYDWALANGYEEGLQLDRIDVEKDYHPENCRWVTPTINSRNQGIRIDNTSGYKGVNYDKRKNLWAVRISVNGKRLYVGRFKKLEDAIEARKWAEKEYWNKDEDIV